MLDSQTVVSIKEDLLSNELTQTEIGEKYGCSRSAVSDIATGRTHRDVPPYLVPVKIQGGQRKNRNLEQQNLSLIGEVTNLRKERNMLNRQLRAAAGRNAAVDEIVERLEPLVKPLPPVKRIQLPRKTAKTIDETLVMMLSDNHCDQVVTPGEVDGLEDYDFPISMRRHEVYVEEALKFTQQSLSNFRFKKLVIFGLGDYTSGEIHGHKHRSYFRDQFVSDLAIAELFGQVFSELAQYFNEVEVVTIVGNHGRLTDKIEYTKESVASNHDTLIMRIAELHCKNINNIEFTFPTGLSHIHNVEGWNFYLHHGHGKAGGSDAWGRAKRKSQTIVPIHKGEVQYFCSGHYHTHGDVTVSGGATLLGNGAFLACDQYSVQGIDEASEPSQLIFGVHPNHGVTWRLPIKLRTEDESPQRYVTSYERPL